MHELMATVLDVTIEDIHRIQRDARSGGDPTQPRWPMIVLRTITTAFDMRVQNKLDRFHLVGDVIDRLPPLGAKGDYLKQAMADKLVEHNLYTKQYGHELPEIRDWIWTVAPSAVRD